MLRSRFLRVQLICLLLLARVTPLPAQPDIFTTVPLPNGMDHSWITDLKQDRYGFMWAATSMGLLRYDGYTWTSFLHNPNSAQSLVSNALEAVCPTRDGRVWVGTKGYGLECLDPETGRVEHHKLAGRADFNTAENLITTLYEDRQGTLWVGTRNGLYSRRAGQRGFTRYAPVPNDPGSLSHGQIRVIYEDRQGTLWIGTGEPNLTSPQSGGLNKFDRKTGRFTRYRHDPADPTSLAGNWVLALYEDSRGTFWVGTWGDGLHTMDRRTGKFTRYPYDPDHPDQLSRPYLESHRKDVEYHIRFIREDGAGQVWIGTNGGGMKCYNPATGNVTYFRARNDSTGGLPGNAFWSACRSRDGVLWLGGVHGHLVRIAPVNRAIYRVESPNGTAVNDFYEDPSGMVWLGTNGGLIARGPQRGAQQPFYQQAARQTRLLSDHVFSFFEDRQGDLWISTWTSGLYRYQRSTGRFTNYRNDPVRPSSLDKGYVINTYEDRSGTIWVMTPGGLHRMEGRADRFTHYRYDPNDSTSIGNGVICALEDRTGTFWVGTWSGGGVCRMDRQTGRFTHFLKGSDLVGQILEDASGTLWVTAGTGGSGGLYRFDRPRDQFRPFVNPATGKTIGNVKSLVTDQAGNLWVGTFDGLVRINRQRDTVTLFGEDYGIKGGQEFYYGSCYRSRDGTLFFGGEGGYYYFRPEQLTKPRSVPPQVQLTALRVANKPVSVESAGPLTKPLAQAEALHLDHDQNVFSFDFVGIHYRHPERNQYTYTLENYDDWRSVGSERTATYYNVPPGEYVFRVKAANSDGVWAEKAIPVIISPPWWRSGVFLTLAVISLGGLVYAGFRYRVAQIRREEARKTALNKHVAELEMQALRAQMNPHFIFNSLNSINYYIIKNERQTASGYLLRFSRLIRLILKNSNSPTVTVQNELDALKLYLDLERLRFDKKFDYTIRCADEVDVLTTEIPPLMLQPYVENAIWHGLMPKEGPGHILVDIRREQSKLVFTIEDNGVGRKKAAQLKSHSATSESMGMQITWHRIELFSELVGRKPQVSIQDLMDADGEGCGTKVIIEIPV
ncbi:sensor histidine kinase [Nibrella saemangeumensis]|uniref:Sensor histidine kinase n=1 Tax=Nibrella saemangeumensis TaxID=1084526 RepID=A0ABP8MS41_9BACT